jgi:hypothetical protein
MKTAVQWNLLVKETISLFRKRLKIFQTLQNGEFFLSAAIKWPDGKTGISTQSRRMQNFHRRIAIMPER